MSKDTTRIPRRGNAASRSTISPRKKPLQARSEETVSVILETAARILERDGLAGFNTNTVAERAGVSIGSLYQYFPNKNALTAALIAKFEEELRAALTKTFAATNGLSLQDSIRRLARTTIHHHARRGSLNRILELEENRLIVNNEPDEHTAKLRSLICSLLHQNRETIAVPHIATAADDLLVMIHSLTDAHLQSAIDLEESEERAVRAISGYLLYRP